MCLNGVVSLATRSIQPKFSFNSTHSVSMHLWSVHYHTIILFAYSQNHEYLSYYQHFSIADCNTSAAVNTHAHTQGLYAIAMNRNAGV